MGMLDFWEKPKVEEPFVETAFECKRGCLTIRGPVLIAHGTKDSIVNPDYSRQAQRAYPNAKLHIIEGDTIHVWCNRKGSRLDAGIALAHLYVANPGTFRFFKDEHMTDLPGYSYIGTVTTTSSLL